MQLLDGKIVRDAAIVRLQKEIASFASLPTLVIIQVGNVEESTRYIEQKKMFAEKIGAVAIHKKYDEASVTDAVILKDIEEYNKDKNIHGILIQIPLPAHLNKEVLINAIAPEKDVDGLTSTSLKSLWDNAPVCIPATAKAILSLLTYYNIPIEGKKIAVVGRSALVGKPTALLLQNHNATVTLCHSKTENLQEETKRADIVIVAIGSPRFITSDYVRPGQTVIDVGINMTADKKLVGDVDFENVKGIVDAISPVPGGVGPMTVTSLFENLVQCYTKSI